MKIQIENVTDATRELGSVKRIPCVGEYITPNTLDISYEVINVIHIVNPEPRLAKAIIKVK